MKFVSKWRVLIPLIIIGAFSVACSTSFTASPESDKNSDFSSIDPTLSHIQSSEIVSGVLGDRLDEYITTDKPLFSGSILVAREGEILLSKGYNYANWELKAPNSSQTKYRISSITKPFTATLIMMLNEEGLIDLEDELCTYLPDCPVHWQEIKIRNLLNHTSGVPEYTTLLGGDNASRDPHNVAGLVDLFREEPLAFAPGESFQYSNSNFILLGAVIEQATGDRYEEFLEKAVLNPLEIENSGLDYHSQILKDRAAGYQIQGRVLVNAPYLDMSNAYATAGMYSTVEDLYRFDQALYSDQLLNQRSQEIMFTPYFGLDGSGGEYGYGWQISEFEGHRKVGHIGGINGFHTSLGRYLDDEVTIILLSNIETEDIESIVTGLEEIIFNQK